MSIIEPLCAYCEKIELDYESLGVPEQLLFPLGSGLRIKNSRCPFCRLVTRLFHEHYRTHLSGPPTILSEQSDVSVVWASANVSGIRRGYMVSSIPGQHCICFLKQVDPLDPTDRKRLSFYLRPSLPAVCDTAWISRCIATCINTHSTLCNLQSTPFSEIFPGLLVLRLIDVTTNCLVEVRSLCQYVALSYVWGDVPNFRLTKANLHKLMIPGRIEDLKNDLPRTISDTIILVRKLGFQYLWVDSLCLLQNDPDDLGRGIAAMDQVYERSSLTVIAACGHDANAGLPGLLEGSRSSHQPGIRVKPGISLGVYTGLDLLLRNSVYNTRAWTFQEHLLSRRAIYFIDNKVFFRCREGESAEFCYDNRRWGWAPRSAALTSSLEPTIYLEQPLQDFAIMLSFYTRRTLTNQDDVFRAMAGIARRVSDKLGPFFQGMPTAALDAFILFSAQGTILRRRAGFPSYSWAGWRGGINLNLVSQIYIREWLNGRTWISWHKRTRSGVTSVVWDPTQHESSPTQDLIDIGYKEPRIFKGTPSLQLSTTRTKPTEILTFETPDVPYPLLQFWTLAVFLRVFDVNVFEATGSLVDSANTICGQVTLDGFEEMTFFDSQVVFEFILLSENIRGAYNIMMLEWNGGVAERRGLGVVEKRVVETGFSPGPVWKEILLA